MSDYRELLLGCGHSRVKKLPSVDGNPHWRQLHTLDVQPQKDERFFLCDLNSSYLIDWIRHWRIDSYRSESEGFDARMESAGKGIYISSQTEQLLVPCDDLPMDAWTFKESIFDEIHAYEVLEHLGSQGDAPTFFSDFSQIWRILKPGGHLLATVPSRFSPWLWGDPSHRRAILPESLVFLDQAEYVRQLDGSTKTAMSDFRYLYKADFKILHAQDDRTTFTFVLEAVKPSRCAK